MTAATGVPRSELGDALRACRGAFIGVGVMSCIINLLYLTGSIFMLEIYDRVLPSRSVPTLIGLIILAGGLYVAQGILDLIRGRILGRIGTSLDEALNARVFDTIVRLPLMVGGRNEGLQPLRDLDNVRSFLGSLGPGAFFDLPWLPFYLAICFAFHVLIGVTALIGAILLVGLTLITEYLSRQPPECRSAGLDGHGEPAQQALERGQREISDRQPERERRHRGPWRGVQGDADDAAIRRARRRRLSGDPPGGHRRHYHRRLDPQRAGTGAGRSRDRPLEGLCRRAAELAPTHPPARADARASNADIVAESIEPSFGRRRGRGCAGRSAGDHHGRELRAAGRQRSWRDRAERLGQVVADPRAGRRLAAGSRQGPDRWRGARPMVLRCARPVRRLSAAGRRAVRRNGGAEHLPLRSRRQVRQDHRGRQGSRRARHDHQDA